MKTSGFALKIVDCKTTPLAKIRLVLAVSAALLSTTAATTANAVQVKLRTYIPSEAVNVDVFGISPSKYVNSGGTKTTQSASVSFDSYGGSVQGLRNAKRNVYPTQLYKKTQAYQVDGAPSWKWRIKEQQKDKPECDNIDPDCTAIADLPKLPTVDPLNLESYPRDVRRILSPGSELISQNEDPTYSFSVNFNLSSKNPLPPPPLPTSPAIDANFAVEVTSKSGEEIHYRVNGRHDRFPAYKLYLDGTVIYEYNPLEPYKNDPTRRNPLASNSPLKLFPPEGENVLGKEGTITTAPEPSSVLGTLAFGILGGSIMLKRKRRSKNV